MTVVVTGGAGFIGSALVRALAGDESVWSPSTSSPTRAISTISRPFSAVPITSSFAPISAIALRWLRSSTSTVPASCTILPRRATSIARSTPPPPASKPTSSARRRCSKPRFVIGARSTRQAAPAFVFLQVSTDEVYGELGPTGQFNDESPYRPSSPYSASKAGADHLARAWHRTYGLPVLVSNCSNNYGPYQFPEKLIPLMVLNGLAGKQLPVYGQGTNIRDWLHVDDHVAALRRIVAKGRVGETYLIGARAEARNIDVVRTICRLLDDRHPEGAPHARLLVFVTDRPGHDARYAIDPSKIERELGWRPSYDLDRGLAATIDWYVANQEWCRRASTCVSATSDVGASAEIA